MNANLHVPKFVNETDRLEGLMLRRIGNRVHNLRVILLPRGMVLQGQASSYHVKQLAQHAAMELSESPILANDIEVT